MDRSLEEPPLSLDRPLSPEEALALAAAAGERGRQAFEVDSRVLYGVWGAVWMIGYGAMSLASWRMPNQPPPLWAGCLFAALLVGAFVVSVAHGASRNAALRGPGRWSNAAWGWAWPIAFGFGMTGLGAIASQIEKPEVAGAVFNTVATLIVGCIYMGGGAALGDRSFYAIGAWFVVTGAVSAVVSVASNLAVACLVSALAGGGGLAVGALLEQVRLTRGLAALRSGPKTGAGPAALGAVHAQGEQSVAPGPGGSGGLEFHARSAGLTESAGQEGSPPIMGPGPIIGGDGGAAGGGVGPKAVGGENGAGDNAAV
ncbi:MAG: hypothetical protein LBO20_05815 [Bifidobacteriaceae bacterium]|jgi:hypothetical protein|nr:hypothetical protein [Bifidobacteriaceae bacterium]